jgi:hypothetical protein
MNYCQWIYWGANGRFPPPYPSWTAMWLGYRLVELLSFEIVEFQFKVPDIRFSNA